LFQLLIFVFSFLCRDLCDQQKRGSLSKVQFRLAMHFVYMVLRKEPLPSTLPDSLLKQASHDTTGAPSSSSSSSPLFELLGYASPQPTPTTSNQQQPAFFGATPMPTSTTMAPSKANASNTTIIQAAQGNAFAATSTATNNDFGTFNFDQFTAAHPQNGANSHQQQPQQQQQQEQFESIRNHNYDQSKFIHKHTMPGMSFEQRADLSNELGAALRTRAETKDKSKGETWTGKNPFL
jgi:hypothetical protein